MSALFNRPGPLVQSTAPYGAPGPQTDGVWLVRSPRGLGSLVTFPNLPPANQGYRFFWLGTTAAGVAQSLGNAGNAIGVDTVTQDPTLAKEFSKIFGKPLSLQQVGSNTPIIPGAPAVGPSDLGNAAKNAGNDLGIPGIGFDFSAITDFLTAIGWLFHPLNWLRMVEILIGIFALYLGLRGSSRLFRSSSPPVMSNRPVPLARRVTRVIRKIPIAE